MESPDPNKMDNLSEPADNIRRTPVEQAVYDLQQKGNAAYTPEPGTEPSNIPQSPYPEQSTTSETDAPDIPTEDTQASTSTRRTVLTGLGTTAAAVTMLGASQVVGDEAKKEDGGFLGGLFSWLTGGKKESGAQPQTNPAVASITPQPTALPTPPTPSATPSPAETLLASKDVNPEATKQAAAAPISSIQKIFQQPQR